MEGCGGQLTLVEDITGVRKVDGDLVHLPGSHGGGLTRPILIGGVGPQPPSHPDDAVLDQMRRPVCVCGVCVSVCVRVCVCVCGDAEGKRG